MLKKPGCLVPLATLAVALLAIAAAVGIVLLSPRVTHPSVLINSPRNAARVPVDQDTVIQAIARDDQKIKRVELWVDDKLQDAQDTNVTGGISPFPLTMTWRPTISRTHTVVVRAFNTQGARSHTAINVQAIQNVDRDDDGMPDAIDACPGQAGSQAARGCPDRDDDGVRDADDACPDQAGPSTARGCPAPSAQDRDGDGLIDSADACPDQPGSPFAQGCPDADGDGVRDSVDACPREAGVAQNGCPTPGDADGDGVPDASDACPRTPGRAEYAGCSDDDGDGVPDPRDACPRERGSAQLAGCPDRDGDGVRDALDLCPIGPGPASNSGCPVSSAGDSDGDGVHDDVDLVPNEAGPADQGGSPPPGRGADRNGNRIPDDVEPPRSEVRVFGVLTIPSLDANLSGLIPGLRRNVPKIITVVEIEAVSFRALESADLTDISCYVRLEYHILNGDGEAVTAETVIPASGELNLDQVTEREWNLPEVLGERAEHNFRADDGYPVRVVVECDGIVSIHGETPRSYNLGLLDVTHQPTDWDGHVMWANSTGGDGGRWFRVEYRLCRDSCEAATFRPPVVELIYHPEPTLAWLWYGSLEGVRAFGIYTNGSVVGEQPASEPVPPGGGWSPADATLFHFELPSGWGPACGESYDFYVTAFGGEAGVPRESPPSNTVVWTGARCPRAVRVTFEMITTGDLGKDESDYTDEGVGPIVGEFWASVNTRKDLHFHISVCCDICYCHHWDIGKGARLRNNSSYLIQDIFDSSLRRGYDVPEVNFVVVELGGDEDLTFGGIIQDVDWGSDPSSGWDTLFDTDDRLRESEIPPSVPFMRTLSNRAIQIVVRIEMSTE